MHRGILLLALAAAPAWPAGKAAADRAPGPAAENKALIAQSPESWLKVYSLPIYRENWTVEIAVGNLGRDLPRVKDVFVRLGASRPAPEGSPEPRGGLAYHCTRKSATEALAQLRSLGRVTEPAVRPILEPVSLSEVQGKIRLLEADQAANRVQLAAMPAVSDLVGEVLDHLRTVEAALLKPDAAVLLRLTVREGK